MKYIRADKLRFDPRPELSRIFVEGFYSWINRFNKDKEQLKAMFAHVFNLDQFYVAVEGRIIAAMTACTRSSSPISLRREVFVEKLGLICGTITYLRIKRNMVRNSYPFNLSPQTGSIEFVACAPEFQQMGITRELILYTMEANPYNAYVLEVADTNVFAVRLYTRLGYKEIKRIKAPSPKRNGVNYFLYMRKEMEERA